MPTFEKLCLYIHGVSDDPTVTTHAPQYASLHEGVRAREARWPAEFLGVEWGWNWRSAADARSHERLAEAQERLGLRALAAVEASSDFTINPARWMMNGLRALMLYGFGDMFYYVSESGKQSVRAEVAEQVVGHLSRRFGTGTWPPLSLTVLAHSAGTVVAFDLLFHLFFENVGGRHVFLPAAALAARDQLRTGLDRLRDMARQGNLRVRRLYTFGAPITPLAFRSDTVVELLAANGRLDPRDYGLDRNPPVFGPALDGPRWINLWDKDDPIAWPVEPLMATASGAKIVEDVYVDVADGPRSAHTAYWSDSTVHREIATRWG